jgi:hypothetical protein
LLFSNLRIPIFPSSSSMRMSRAAHRLTIWIASFAILLAALAPSISHAVAAATGGVPNGWTEVCTADGAKLVKLDGAPSSPDAPADKALHFEHCPFCLHHATGAGLLPASDIALPAPAESRAFPTLFYQASYPKPAWAVAQPRAPPVLS